MPRASAATTLASVLLPAGKAIKSYTYRFSFSLNSIVLPPAYSHGLGGSRDRLQKRCREMGEAGKSYVYQVMEGEAFQDCALRPCGVARELSVRGCVADGFW